MPLTSTRNSTPSLSNLGRPSASRSPTRRRNSCPKKTLSFSQDLCKVQMIECLANTTPQNKNEIWYDGRELGGMRKKEIKKVKHAQIIAGQGKSIETEDLTWRGFEDIQGHWCRVEKSAEYTTAVVKHYHSQVNQGYSDADELKRIAKGLSKTERTRARNLALKDMEEVGIKMDKKSRLRKSSSSVQPLPERKSSSSTLTMRKTMSTAGLSQLRKNVSGANMMKLASKMSIGNGLKAMGGKSTSSNGAPKSNFQWLRKNGADVKPTRVAVMSA